MKLEIDSIVQAGCDRLGNFAMLEVQIRRGPKRWLQMTLPTAGQLIGHLCRAGLLAHQARDSDESEVATRDVPVMPDAAAAGIRQDGGVDLVLRFGRVSLSAALDPTTARSLGQALVQATTPAAGAMQ